LRNRLESFHNMAHVWVGGCMLYGTSPNDPVFYMNHLYVDKIWADWQIVNPTAPYFLGNATVKYPSGHGLNDPMWPWDGKNTPPSIARPVDMLDNSAIGVRYGGEDWKPEWDDINQPAKDFVNYKSAFAEESFIALNWNTSGSVKFNTSGSAVLDPEGVVRRITSLRLAPYTDYVFKVEVSGTGNFDLSLDAFSATNPSGRVAINSVQGFANGGNVNASIPLSVLSSHHYLREPLIVSISSVSGVITAKRVWVQTRDISKTAPTNVVLASSANFVCDDAVFDKAEVEPTTTTTANTIAPTSSSSSSNTGMIVGIVFGVIGGLALVALVAFFSYNAGKKASSGVHSSHVQMH